MPTDDRARELLHEAEFFASDIEYGPHADPQPRGWPSRTRRDDFVRKIRAYLAGSGEPSPPEPLKACPPVIAFLLGEGELQGHWFGEGPLGQGRYWWRTALREWWNRRAGEKP